MRCRYLLAGLGSALVSLVASLSAAQTTSYGSFEHHADLPGALFLNGEIKDNDSFELRRAMRDQTITIVVTASPGGSLYEGLQIASILNDNGISTYVPAGASCESSCANVFLGGKSRMAVGELGVHQFYSGGPDATSNAPQNLTTATTQYTTAEIIGIMNQFNTPPFVYEKMFGTTEIYYFKASEKPRLNQAVEDEAFAADVAAVDDLVAREPRLLVQRASGPSPDVSAAAPPPPAPPPAQPGPQSEEPMANVDFFGMDLTQTGHRGITLQACDAICRANPACAAWSYVVATQWCWPKSGVQNISFASGTISQVVDWTRINVAIFDRPFLEATGVDVVGYDIFPRGMPNTSLAACRDACAYSSTCRAFTWVAKKNWCFPKYGADQFRDQLGVVSGVKK